MEVDKYSQPDTCKLLIGNKSDRTDRVVTEAEGGALAKELSMPFLETSARTAENVETAFIVRGGGVGNHALCLSRHVTPVHIKTALTPLPASSPLTHPRKWPSN